MADTPSAILVETRGHGPSVVFLPGYPLDHRIWNEQLTALSDDHTVVLVDLPGFGADWRTTAPETLTGFAESVADTLLSGRQRPATIVGHSFGGYIALKMYLDHSELFDRLVLVSTRSTSDTPEQRAKRLAAAQALEGPDRHLDVEATVRGLVAEASWEASSSAVRVAREAVASVRADSARGALRAMASRPDLTPVLRDVKVPTLVLWGTADRLIPPAETEAMVSIVPQATGIGIPGAGHLPMLETAERFNSALRGFLGGRPPA
jgi:pimeloyl-ACP methyl ester carboxylesterase